MLTLIQTLIVSCALQVAPSAADYEPVVVCAEDGSHLYQTSSCPQRENTQPS